MCIHLLGLHAEADVFVRHPGHEWAEVLELVAVGAVGHQRVGEGQLLGAGTRVWTGKYCNCGELDHKS